jgi:hypothetical protein
MEACLRVQTSPARGSVNGEISHRPLIFLLTRDGPKQRKEIEKVSICSLNNLPQKQAKPRKRGFGQ